MSRSYYRCTTQKCSVKKRVERSYQDPSIVITTYEGQHTHQSPATIRGSSHLLVPPPSMMPMSSSFHQDHLQLNMHQFPQLTTSQHLGTLGVNPSAAAAASIYLQNIIPSMSPAHHNNNQQQLRIPDYGLLQDIVPSAFINTNQLPWSRGPRSGPLFSLFKPDGSICVLVLYMYL